MATMPLPFASEFLHYLWRWPHDLLWPMGLKTCWSSGTLSCCLRLNSETSTVSITWVHVIHPTAIRRPMPRSRTVKMPSSCAQMLTQVQSRAEEAFASGSPKCQPTESWTKWMSLSVRWSLPQLKLADATWEGEAQMADLEGQSSARPGLTWTVGRNMQMHARWLCPLPSAAADHSCPGTKVPLSGERYQPQHPVEATRTQSLTGLSRRASCRRTMGRIPVLSGIGLA